jgi:hypothetical protein
VAGKVYVPWTSPSLPDILEAAHSTAHEGVAKTLQRLCLDFHIPGAQQVVQDFVRACAICQRNKSEHVHLAAFLQPLDVPSSVWADVAMDFVEGFPCVNGKSVILTVVDWFSKYSYFIPLEHLYTATTVVKAFFDNIVRLHNIPCSIFSDRDPVFTS